MKKEFLGYVFALACAVAYMHVAADGRLKNTDLALLYKKLEQQIKKDFEQQARRDDLSGALLLLSIIANDAIQKGEKAPNYNLCQLGTICRDNKGIRRINMPQLTGKPVPGSMADTLPRDKRGNVDGKEYFGRYLVDNMNYTVNLEEVPLISLKATQNELIGTKVAGIYMTLQEPDSAAYKELQSSYIYISSDDYILDGHHRWAALLADAYRKGNIIDATIRVKRIGAPISDLVELANLWAADFGIQSRAGSGDDSGAVSVD